MKIEVRLYASLAPYMPKEAGDGTDPIEMEDGTTVLDILTRWNVPRQTVKLIFVNGVHATEDRALKAGDRLGVFPPVAGG